jgi:hypothetical protein
MVCGERLHPLARNYTEFWDLVNCEKCLAKKGSLHGGDIAYER